MNRRTSSNAVIFRVAAILLILIMLSVYLLSGMMAKYKSTASGDSSVSVASIDVAGTGTYASHEIPFDDMLPGETKTYDFTVKSNSEVSVKCSAAIETTENLPLSFTIKQNDTVISPDDLCSFPIGQKEEAFTLYATWDENAKDVKFKDEIDAIRIIVTAQQID